MKWDGQVCTSTPAGHAYLIISTLNHQPSFFLVDFRRRYSPRRCVATIDPALTRMQCWSQLLGEVFPRNAPIHAFGFLGYQVASQHVSGVSDSRLPSTIVNSLLLRHELRGDPFRITPIPSRPGNHLKRLNFVSVSFSFPATSQSQLN